MSRGLRTDIGTLRRWTSKNAKSAPNTPQIAPEAPTLTRKGDDPTLASAPPTPAAR